MPGGGGGGLPGGPWGGVPAQCLRVRSGYAPLDRSLKIIKKTIKKCVFGRLGGAPIVENWALWGSLGGLGGVLGWSWGVWRGKGAADCAERLNILALKNQ